MGLSFPLWLLPWVDLLHSVATVTHVSFISQTVGQGWLWQGLDESGVEWMDKAPWG